MPSPATQTPSPQQHSAQSGQFALNLQELLDNLFLVLTEKEATVVNKRFALQGHQKQTLEKIGKHFNVTRERIRQIESIALSKLKRTVRTTKLDEVNEMAKGILRLNGGLMREDECITAVLRRIQGSSAVDGSVLRLSFSIDAEMVQGTRSNTFVPFWRLESLAMDDILLIVNSIVRILKKRKACMQADELVSAIQAMNLFEGRVPSRELILSCLKIDDRLKEIPEGWGLTEWRFVRPRSIRDKVEIILKKSGEPLHFMEIANRIREAHFDHKNVTVQAVHNELIRYPQFVLVGRGLYALKDWGYEPGTVADVIERILKEKGPLSKKEIIAEVGKQRTVKVGTISLNLQKMPYFVRVGRAVYAFDQAKKK
ncbi:MAG: sigma factor-like helix-turn-helix DNA-binding protein [Candidatus Peribacteraceae bacterium]|nr:sigma factor-like helix-turn-helix DNA-binding protein [Candidatus Peribacteraceae bacterium]